MRKNWYELTPKGKKRRLNEACTIADADCLTDDFWRAYDQKDYDKARKILKENNNKGGKIGYHYPKNYDVDDLLTSIY